MECQICRCCKNAAASPAVPPLVQKIVPTRFALLVGNSNYPRPHDLPPIHKNVYELAKVLQTRGFEVTQTLDLGASDFNAALEAFKNKVRATEGPKLALVYYAGHGLQLQSENLLLGAGTSPAAERSRAAEAVVESARGIVPLAWTAPGRPYPGAHRCLPHRCKYRTGQQKRFKPGGSTQRLHCQFFYPGGKARHCTVFARSNDFLHPGLD
ncbi:MAG: caspase family protein [Limnobacter sp.]|nr:caspase family protein [Limnobacter sp.]